MDTTILVPLPQDEMLIQALIECDSTNKAQLEEMIFKSKYQYVSLRVENGLLTQIASLTKDSLTAIIQTQKQTITKLHSEINNKQQTITIKEVYIPRYVKFFAWSGAIMYLLIAIVIVWNVWTR
jgi:hypothetical protein